MYCPYWLDTPTLPLAFSSALWFSYPQASSGVIHQPDTNPLFELTSLLEYYPTKSSFSAEADQLLSWAFVPYSTYKESKVHLTRVNPPATFRLQGLVTLLAIYSLRSRAGFFSHRRRSWDSPFGVFSFRKVFGPLQSELAHLPFNLVVFPPPKRWAGPIGPGFRALTLPEIPDDRTKF
jgi:hypothetical protein